MLYRKLIEEYPGGKKPVFFDETRVLSVPDLHSMTAVYSAVFQSLGVEQGDRILVPDDDPIEMMIVLMACIANGYVCVPVSRLLDAESLDFIIHDCKPACIVDEEFRQIMNRKMKELDEDAVVCHLESRTLCGEDTLVYIIYTSGSEGFPKGVVASQKQILFSSKKINERLGNSDSDRILCSLSLAFDYGLYQIFLALLSGAELYFCKGDVLQRIPYLLQRWKITAFPMIPSMANLMVKTGMLKYPGNTVLRYITFTGEVLPVTLIKELWELLPGVRIIPMYGLTECKRVSVMPEGRKDKVLEGSCGLPLKDVSVRLDDPDQTTGIGELVVAGDNVMEGYWNCPEGKNSIFSKDPHTGKKELHTGDLFFIDEEGFLYFRGRKNGIIKICGYRINCAWIENKLKQCQDIIEVSVSGEKDSLTGEHLEIWVYSRQEDMEQKMYECMGQFPDYLQNYRLHMSSKPLPKTSGGKIDIQKLQGKK
ncbi:MAG: acyl--CoA ligase [Lachnospiraceae bacterium]|nr:acyl--CoA ligase [Lachnospiraceae bacterium]